MNQDATLSRELVDLAIVLMRIVKQQMRTESTGSSPTLTQFRILNKVRDGVCHIGKLAEVFGISQPATSIMVATMVKDGLLKRSPHLEDRRQVQLRLTAKGLAKLETTYQRAFATVDERLSTLSPSKQAAMSKHVRDLFRLLSPSDAEVHHE